MLIPEMRMFLLLVLCAISVECGFAQIKIIPRQRLDSINNIATLAHSPMRFVDGESIRFDTIAENCGTWHHVVEWRNEGKKPIVINEIKSSCGCLRAQCDKRILRGGESANITVKYYPKGHPGRVSQRLFFYTSLEDNKPTGVLHLSGYVEPSTDRRDDYPKSRGVLLLRQDEIIIDGSRIYRIACYNSGDRALRLSADTLLSTMGVGMRTEPAEIPVKGEGDLIITCDERRVTDNARLYIKGLSVAPRESMIILRRDSEENKNNKI